MTRCPGHVLAPGCPLCSCIQPHRLHLQVVPPSLHAWGEAIDLHHGQQRVDAPSESAWPLRGSTPPICSPALSPVDMSTWKTVILPGSRPVFQGGFCTVSRASNHPTIHEGVQYGLLLGMCPFCPALKLHSALGTFLIRAECAGARGQGSHYQEEEQVGRRLSGPEPVFPPCLATARASPVTIVLWLTWGRGMTGLPGLWHLSLLSVPTVPHPMPPHCP